MFLKKINLQKAPGSDDIPGYLEILHRKTILTCQYSRLLFLHASKQPLSFQDQKKPFLFNDYLYALTPFLTKCFERLVMEYIR